MFSKVNDATSVQAQGELLVQFLPVGCVCHWTQSLGALGRLPSSVPELGVKWQSHTYIHWQPSVCGRSLPREPVFLGFYSAA